MKRFFYSIPGKLILIAFFCLCVLGAIGGGATCLYLYEEDAYRSPPQDRFIETNLCESMAYRDAVEISSYFEVYLQTDGQSDPYLDRYYAAENTNFRFRILDQNGAAIASNTDMLDSSAMVEEYRFYSYTSKDDESYDLQAQTEENLPQIYTIEFQVDSALSVTDRYKTAAGLYDFAFSARYGLAILTLICLVFGILSFVALLCVAGHRKDEDALTLSALDRFPFDVLCFGVVLIFCLGFPIFNYYDWSELPLAIAAVGLITLVTALSVALLCMTLASRLKSKSFWKTTLLYRILRPVKRWMLYLWGKLKELARGLPLIWKAVLVYSLISILEFILIIFMFNNPGGVLLWLAFRLSICGVLCLVSLNLMQLKKGGDRIVSGDLSQKVETSNMIWEFRKFGESLNNISAGLSRAVDEKMKSERMKTELITNVSHDIKTPLTSIVNYVDLLKKENYENEHVREYVEVLDRQSRRLKKLTEDLVEASKATTGNITVNPAKTNVGELLNQSIAEYAEPLNANGLEPVLTLPEEPVYIYADGRLLWRVFDNLLGNICKYAMPGTRVYFDLNETDRKVNITLKNISRSPLNISAEELMERFVRGDSSRSTEGSGLGLSIARSLIELQNGVFRLAVDGDLFKVSVQFNALEQAPTSGKQA